MLATVPCQDWNTLAGCNRQLRTFIHSSVQAITINHTSDFGRCVKGLWPQLALLKFKPAKLSTTFPEWPVECNFQLLASFWRTEGIGGKVMAQLIRCRKQLQELDCHHHIAGALSHFSGPEWRHTTYLSVTLHMLKAEVMTQIACLDLPHLLSLSFRDSSLQTAEIRAAGIPEVYQSECINFARKVLEQCSPLCLIATNMQTAWSQ